MSIAAKISSDELRSQVTDRFAGAYLEARLIYAAGASYTPGTTDDANFLTFEVTPGTNGYQRQIISYSAGDVSAYADKGVGLATRATTFTHDGSNTTIDFTHVVLVWSGGNVLTLPAGNIPTRPASGESGTYTNIPIDTTNGNGVGMTVDLTINSTGTQDGDWSLEINRPGYGYAAGDTLTISEGTLVGLGAIPQGAGLLATTVGTVTTQADEGNILAVAPTSGTASLTSGNQAVFYWNLKQFGFYSTTQS